MKKYRFLIIDDHPIIREGFRRLVQGKFRGCSCYEAGSIEELAGLWSERPKPHLLIVDLELTSVPPLSSLIYARTTFPRAIILAVSERSELMIAQRAQTFGADGFITKCRAQEEIVSTIEKLLSGENGFPSEIFNPASVESPDVTSIAGRLLLLSRQQVHILILIRKGLPNKQIAHVLGISEATVKTHVSKILKKMHAENRTQAVAITEVVGDFFIQRPIGKQFRKMDQAGASKCLGNA